MIEKLYYVSQDLHLIMQRWCNATGLNFPDESIFIELQNELIEALKHAFREPVNASDGSQFMVAIEPLPLADLAVLQRKKMIVVNSG